MNKRRFFIILFFLAIAVLITYGLSRSVFHRQASPTNQDVKRKSENISNVDELCISRINIRDLNNDGIDEVVDQCKDSIKVFVSPQTDDEWKTVPFETKDSFPDLFIFPQTRNYLPREIMVVPEKNPHFVLVKATNYGVTYILETFGIYIVQGKQLKRVFKKGYNDIQGRSSHVEFSATKPEFTLTSQRNLLEGKWQTVTEYYIWSKADNTFKLVNKKRINE